MESPLFLNMRSEIRSEIRPEIQSDIWSKIRSLIVMILERSAWYIAAASGGLWRLESPLCLSQWLNLIWSDLRSNPRSYPRADLISDPRSDPRSDLWLWWFLKDLLDILLLPLEDRGEPSLRPPVCSKTKKKQMILRFQPWEQLPTEILFFWKQKQSLSLCITLPTLTWEEYVLMGTIISPLKDLQG